MIQIGGAGSLLTLWLAIGVATIGIASAEDLDEVLDHVFGKYAGAREELLLILNQSSQPLALFTLEEWENLLQPDAGMELTSTHLQDLENRHSETILKAMAAAKSDDLSQLIDIDSFRSNKDEVMTFCEDFPRVAMLHVHPSGTYNETTVRHLLREFNPKVDGELVIQAGNSERLGTILYEDEISFLQSLDKNVSYLSHSTEDQDKIFDFFFLPPGKHDFRRFQAIFEVSKVILRRNSSFNSTYANRVTHVDFLERAKRYGLSYVEFTKSVIPPNRTELEKVVAEYQLYSEETGVHVNFDMAFVRTFPNISVNAEYAEIFVDTLSDASNSDVDAFPSLVGIDLLGNELGYPALEVAQQAYPPISNAWQGGNAKFPIGGLTMHAGELGGLQGARNMRDGMIMGATRIGHGVLLDQDPVILEYAIQNKLPLVMSIESNFRLDVIPGNGDYSDHPFLKYLRLGLPVSLSTDDEGMFETHIANECAIAISNTDIQYSELKEISYNAVHASFASEALKEELLEELDEKFANFENRYQTGGDDEGGLERRGRNILIVLALLISLGAVIWLVLPVVEKESGESAAPTPASDLPSLSIPHGTDDNTGDDEYSC